MTFLKTLAAAALAAGTLLTALQPVAAASSDTVVKRDHRTQAVVRDHRTQPIVRDHRGVEGRVRPTRKPGTICAGWAC